MRLLPDTDRTPTGYLRWRVWAPFWVLAYLNGRVAPHVDGHPLLLAVFGVFAAFGLPWFLALLLTRRRPAPAPVQPPSPGEQP